MPVEYWLVRWRRNRNHCGEEMFFSYRKAFEIAESKKSLGYKVKIIKLSKLEIKKLLHSSEKL